MHVKRPMGISAVTFRRLCARAFTTLRFAFFVRARRRVGIGSCFLPESHGPLTDFGSAITSAAVPCETIVPPCTPAPGPMSTT